MILVLYVILKAALNIVKSLKTKMQEDMINSSCEGECARLM